MKPVLPRLILSAACSAAALPAMAFPSTDVPYTLGMIVGDGAGVPPHVGQVRAGIVAAIQGANRAGGVHGRALRLVSADDEGRRPRTIERSLELIERDDALALLAPADCATASALVPVARATRTAVIGPLCGAPLLRGPGTEDIFHVREDHRREADAIAARLLQHGARKFAAVGDGDAFGRSWTTAVRAALDARTADVAFVGEIHAIDGQTGAAVARLLRGQPDVILVHGTAGRVPGVIALLREAGFAGPLAIAADASVADVGGQTLGPPPRSPAQPNSSGPRATASDPPACPAPDAAAAARHLSAAFIEGCQIAHIAVAGLRLAGPDAGRHDLIDALGRLDPVSPMPARSSFAVSGRPSPDLGPHEPPTKATPLLSSASASP